MNYRTEDPGYDTTVLKVVVLNMAQDEAVFCMLEVMVEKMAAGMVVGRRGDVRGGGSREKTRKFGLFCLSRPTSNDIIKVSCR